MILADFLWEDGNHGDIYPIETDVPLQVVPRVDDFLDLNAEPGEWHAFRLNECRFRVCKVVQYIDIGPVGEHEEGQQVKHKIDLYLEPTNASTRIQILRLKNEQGKSRRHGK
jgi:hypothetical protein